MKRTLCLILLLITFPAVRATEPPDLMNYQGVLRDAADNPLNGDYDMVFRFWGAETGGHEVIIDRHTTLDSAPVTVSDGMFAVELGAGLVLDGAGPDDYTSMHKLFKNYSTVWLEIEVGGEVLSPRVRVRSAAYAFNAMHLGGRIHNQYLNDSSNAQTKTGELIVDTSSLTDSISITGSGSEAGGYFADSTDGSYAYLGYNAHGIFARGQQIGGEFQSENGSGSATLANTDTGVEGYGSLRGGYFEDTDGSGRAYVGSGDYGIWAYGSTGGGYFSNTLTGATANLASGGNGLTATGPTQGGYFSDSDGSGYARAGYGETGIEARGNLSGGHFRALDDSGYAFVGHVDSGITAYGNNNGGYFKDVDNSGYVYAGAGDFGVSGHGNNTGGYFEDLNSTGHAHVGHGDFGIDARGEYQAFRFGGGGRFLDTFYTGVAYVAHGNQGIYAEGSDAGGVFTDTDSGNFGRVGFSTYKIWGTGSVSFVQNHPEDESKVIVYHAPEASEVAVYTRGSARLDNGVAHVALDETFQWTANPDLGLTAHLTPRGPGADLHVLSISTTELMVAGSQNIEFDYMVWGLRIGFEESAPVQEKHQEARIPSMDDHRDLYAVDGSLRGFNALERFQDMEGELRGADRASLDLSRSDDLVARIGEYDPELHGDLEDRRDDNGIDGTGPPSVPVDGAQDHPTVESTAAPSAQLRPAGVPMDTEIEDPAPDTATWLAVAEPVEPGDVLVLDPQEPGLLRRAASLADPNVVGIAAGPSRKTAEGGLEAPMADGRYATVRVDAGYGPILPGDLLVASPTPGHGMRAIDLQLGVVLGKAIDGLESGTGTIRVLITLR